MESWISCRPPELIAILRIALALTRVRSLACRIWSWSAGESSSSRPEKRSSIPRRPSSSTSRRMVSENRLIKASTSSRGRDQFSVEKAYSVRPRPPRRSAASATRRMVSIPALCPMTRGSKRSRAQRLLPSMMIATCSGGGNWLTSGSWALDLHDLGFLAGGHLVDQTDVAIRDLLQLVAPAPRLVGRDLLLFLERLHAIHLLAADIANRDVRTLGITFDQSGVLTAPFFVQGRNRDSDQLPVVSRVQSELRFLDRFLDGADDRPVPWLDDDQARLGDGNRGELVQGCRIPVILHEDLVHQRRAGSPGADGQDLFAEGLQALLHLGLGVLDVRFDHSGAPTIVPIGLPPTTPSRLPACDRSNTMIGMLFSRQSVTAVWSITRRSLLIKSR